MINKEKLNQLIKSALSEAGQQLSDADIGSHTDNITPKLEQIVGYPDWDVRDDTQADIDFMIIQVNNNDLFKTNLKQSLVDYLKSSLKDTKTCWFVGATWSDEDQSDRFLKEGIWENGYEDEHLESVRAMEPGDNIAIKSTYTKKHGFDFDTRGNIVSVMAIKAIGTVIKNIGDGRQVEVDWNTPYEPKEWLFYTYQQMIWRVNRGDWRKDALIDFAFNGIEQDVDKFRNSPKLKDRFGDLAEGKLKFKWTAFYEAIASKLLDFKDKRKELITFILKLSDEFELTYMQGKELDDICPFTVMGVFNRQIKENNRKAIATKLATFLDVSVPCPDSFEGIPVLNNQKSWFFAGVDRRQPNDINNLWEIFETALNFSDKQNEINRQKLLELYDIVSAQHIIGWNLSMGLYWARAWMFPTLDTQSRSYLKKLNIKLELNGAKGRASGSDYLEVRDILDARFSESSFPVHSFPELSLKAFQQPAVTEVTDKTSCKSLIIERIKILCRDNKKAEFTRQEFLAAYSSELSELFPDNNKVESTIDRHMQVLRNEDLLEFMSPGVYYWLGFEDDQAFNGAKTKVLAEPYSVKDLIKDGCFLPESDIESIIKQLERKKNIILQGPPGTGKTWLAKRLALALMGEKQESNICAVQFHPNLSYEDFIRGWRPSGDGKLSLIDGPFLDAVELASKKPNDRIVVVIEEINRGNPAQIFGEMLTLLEADKRTPDEALQLSYSKEKNERVHIPDNLFVIGTMNIADRSLALMDLALRRRFAFVNLYPILGEVWINWVHDNKGIDKEFLTKIEHKINNLNSNICDDKGLGKQFQVGHSYVIPAFDSTIDDAQEWFTQVVETEIFPLLEEYWFDEPEKAEKEKLALLKDI
jgi:5-methylcytosine-specific restriction protein B